MREMLGDELEPLIDELKKKLLQLNAAPAVQTWKTKKRRRRILRLVFVITLVIAILYAAQRVANLL